MFCGLPVIVATLPMFAAMATRQQVGNWDCGAAAS